MVGQHTELAASAIARDRMVEYGGNRYPTLCPYIYYEDSGAALEWLARRATSDTAR